MKMIGFQLFALITLATACWLFAIPMWGLQSPLQVTTRLAALLVGCLLFGALLVLVARHSSASVWISGGLL